MYPQRSLRPAPGANETSPVKNPGVRRAWNAGEHDLKGAPVRWRVGLMVG
jgi:hypothetical protein